MNMKLYILPLLLLPALAKAQPSIQLAQDYNIGTTITYRKCTPMAAGAAGASQTWNFSSLVPFTTKDTLTVSYVGPGSVYAGATILEKSSDSTYQYIKKGLLEDNTVAVADSSVAAGNLTVTFAANNAVSAIRPLVFNLSYIDTFSCVLMYSGLSVPSSGINTRNFKVDGWGTLTTPAGTFNNVVRLRVVHAQVNSVTIPVPGSVNTNITTYMWFDAQHKAPLLRLDSTSIVSTPTGPSKNSATVVYLLKETYPSDVPVMNGHIDFSAGFSNNQLILNGNFVASKEYETAVYTLSGQRMFAGSFTANGTRQAFNINEAAAGIYFVLVSEKGNAGTLVCSKVVKE